MSTYADEQEKRMSDERLLERLRAATDGEVSVTCAVHEGARLPCPFNHDDRVLEARDMAAEIAEAKLSVYNDDHCTEHTAYDSGCSQCFQVWVGSADARAAGQTVAADDGVLRNGDKIDTMHVHYFHGPANKCNCGVSADGVLDDVDAVVEQLAQPRGGTCHFCKRELALQGGLLPLHAKTVREELDMVNPIACRGSRTVPSDPTDEVDERRRVLETEFNAAWENNPNRRPNDVGGDAEYYFLAGVAVGDRLGRRAEAVELGRLLREMMTERISRR